MFRFVPGRVLYVGAWFFGFSFSSVDHKCLMVTQLIFMPSFFFSPLKGCLVQINLELESVNL